MSTTSPSNAPSHSVYVVQGEGESAIWTEIGAAWPHKDGEGYFINLQALPIISENHKMVIRKRKAKQEAKR